MLQRHRMAEGAQCLVRPRETEQVRRNEPFERSDDRYRVGIDVEVFRLLVEHDQAQLDHGETSRRGSRRATSFVSEVAGRMPDDGTSVSPYDDVVPGNVLSE